MLLLCGPTDFMCPFYSIPMTIALVFSGRVVILSPFRPSTRLGSFGGKHVAGQVQVAAVTTVVVYTPIYSRYTAGPCMYHQDRQGWLVSFRSLGGVPVGMWHQDGDVHSVCYRVNSKERLEGLQLRKYKE